MGDCHVGETGVQRNLPGRAGGKGECHTARKRRADTGGLDGGVLPMTGTRDICSSEREQGSCDSGVGLRVTFARGGVGRRMS